MNKFGQNFNNYSFDECETVIKKIQRILSGKDMKKLQNYLKCI